ncbi:hypothetical protein [Agrobacterium tumefaciens]|jgi:hypothetical protein|nr:hypothetical protein [Agrobacterium tumefaciens]NSZ33313.1 hypothetical protein [Agrobacterium tumefaciens]QLG25700.1 hypothetical protein EML4_25660 [Agrobacterium tumefaciens]UXS89322.1 hypothetical protein FY144_24040 [Agrobacterium tumefaciens]
MMTFPWPEGIAMPDRSETSLSVSRKKFIFAFFRFQEGDGEKLALSLGGC